MENKRVHGLDTLRALAIILVFLYHYAVFVSKKPDFGWMSVSGWLGVDLFFVLSGYLIGNQLLSHRIKDPKFSLKDFYARRALRTWPVFWIVLTAYFVFPIALGGKDPPPLWAFLTFTQNFGLLPGTAFSHAWSLCIEEQFYLVLPLAFLAARRIGLRKTQIWVLLGALMAVGITSRGVLWASYGREDIGDIAGYYPKIYYATLCRFDEFLPGIALALLKNFDTSAWNKIICHGKTLFFVGIGFSILLFYSMTHFYYIEDYGYGFFLTTFGYSLAAIVFSILVASALSPSSWLYRVRIPGAYHLSLWSYSIYLSHKAVAHMVQKYAVPRALSPTATFLVISAVSVLVGALLHYLVEAPFLRLRNRYFSSTKRDKIGAT